MSFTINGRQLLQVPAFREGVTPEARRRSYIHEAGGVTYWIVPTGPTSWTLRTPAGDTRCDDLEQAVAGIEASEREQGVEQ